MAKISLECHNAFRQHGSRYLSYSKWDLGGVCFPLSERKTRKGVLSYVLHTQDIEVRDDWCM